MFSLSICACQLLTQSLQVWPWLTVLHVETPSSGLDTNKEKDGKSRLINIILLEAKPVPRS